MSKKHYLSKTERLQVSVMILAQGIKKQYLAINEKNMYSNEKKYYKSSLTFFEKALGELFRRTGTDNANKIIKEIKYYKLAMVPTSKAKQLETKDEGHVILDREEFEDLVEGIMESKCKQCKLGKRKAKRCVIRDLFIKNDIPECNPGGICPYRAFEEELLGK